MRRGRFGRIRAVRLGALLAGLLLCLAPRSALAVDQLEAALVTYLPCATYEAAGQQFARMRQLGINTVILRVFHHQGDRFYPFVDPRAGAGVYFSTTEAPVVEDILSRLIPMAHAEGLKVFAWMSTLTTDLGGSPELFGGRYDLARKEIVPSDRLDPFHPEVRRRLLTLFRDLGRYDLDGILLQNDLAQSHTEGFSDAGTTAYFLRGGETPDPKEFYRDWETAPDGTVRVRSYSPAFWEWARWKSRYLVDLAKDLQVAARRKHPRLPLVPNLAYEVLSNPPGGRAWFSQDFGLAAEAGFDYLAVTMYHRQMARELRLSREDALVGIRQLTRTGLERLKEPAALLMEVQTVDFADRTVIEPTEWRRVAREIRRSGPVSLAFFPYQVSNDVSPAPSRQAGEREVK